MVERGRRHFVSSRLLVYSISLGLFTLRVPQLLIINTTKSRAATTWTDDDSKVNVLLEWCLPNCTGETIVIYSRCRVCRRYMEWNSVRKYSLMTGALADDDYVPPLHNAAVTSRESPRPWSCPVEDVSHRDVTSATSVVHSSTAGRQTTQPQLIA